eukprot:CAMPEP_0119104740 /NCGR_PEP_ID=MMETSP1180-20130426/2876_1 /TAXON_ID=3052 ORGANISM="Chlamydomonas cf sp, Strain CCMP681" /NCGR_SAMPLE_ID=MMETSP1180 /ASSEMBLY_ACC=CAM_ASM_000741 /LENGTH=320 /DNA_ID=CAMNT_0007089573 /DNA_START=39 /DNA_END=1001 /DNA_ORIENTATION=-
MLRSAPSPCLHVRQSAAFRVSAVPHMQHCSKPPLNVCAPAPGTVQQTTSVHVERREVLGLGLGLFLFSLVPPALATDDQRISTVFVAGSSGNTGRRIVQQLRAQGYAVRAGVRDLAKARKQALYAGDEGVVLVSGDVLLKPGPLQEAIGGAQAVICATGYTGFNPGGFAQVDEVGSKNLVDAAKAKGVVKFVFVSSLLTNARANGQAENPNYKFLNLFGGVLDHKLVAEQYLRASGLNYTIVRPGGLSEEPPSVVGNLIARPEDTLFGLDTDPGRQVSRDTVAAVCVAALSQSSADNEVVEIVASPSAPEVDPSQWFPKA